MQQSSKSIFMVRPSTFGFNIETALSNSFQNPTSLTDGKIAQKALEEFDNAVQLLTRNEIHVDILQDSKTPIKPDAIFPNNWLSTHHNGTLVTYPMCTPNRRVERNDAFIDFFKEHYLVEAIKDYSTYESKNKFLEGTGSIVFDHSSMTAFACRSIRTDPTLFQTYCEDMNYEPILFDSRDRNGDLIYHTNVIMAIGTQYALICLESITDLQERSTVVKKLKDGGKEIIEISLDQVYQFAGNALEVINKKGQALLVLSQNAFNSLNATQKKHLEQYAKLLPIPIPTIENTGGGSIRCMMGQVFLIKK